jgi:hypothetical protein
MCQHLAQSLLDELEIVCTVQHAQSMAKLVTLIFERRLICCEQEQEL